MPFTDLIDYRLEVQYPGVPAITVADAYRFLPTLGEIDLHLFAEGRHERLWETLGAHRRSFTTPTAWWRATPSRCGPRTPRASA